MVRGFYGLFRGALVTDTGTDVIDGVPLYWYELTYPLGNGDTITERYRERTIADYWHNPFWYSCFAIDIIVPLQVCYSDHEISTGHRCMDQGWFETMSVGEIEFVSLSLYPNPADQFIYVSLPETESLKSYSVLDVHGRELQSGTFTAGYQEAMDISALPAGLYIIKVITATGASAVARFVKQ